MIGPQLRKALSWAAVIYMLAGPIVVGVGLYERTTNPGFEIVGAPFMYWLQSLVGLVATVVQGGVLLVLLSIDQRLQNRSA